MSRASDTQTREIRRHSERQTVNIASGGTASDPIDASQHAFGAYHIPATFDGVSVTFEATPDDGTTWQPIHSEVDNALINPASTAGKSYPIPARVMHFDKFRIVSSSSETAERSIVVELKG